jgi:3-hydroxyacyl-[acyl-carrier protein] dehydratase / trans-2-decenoyl-[acyl-carrier protein] isomerase
MPGCLGVDALWQLGGFFLSWVGCKGQGRALGCDKVVFDGEIRPHNKLVTYELSVKRVVKSPSGLILADGKVLVDGKLIYTCDGLRVGTFTLPYEWPTADGQ